MFHGPQTQSWRDRYFVSDIICFRRRSGAGRGHARYVKMRNPRPSASRASDFVPVKLEVFGEQCFYSPMGRFLDRLLEASTAYDVRRDKDGYFLIANPAQPDAFNDVVRDAVEKAGDDFVVFPTSDGHHGYSQMFIIPLD